MKNKIHPIYQDHHKVGGFATQIREVVFGAEDGMVSTLGAITGIAVGSGDQFTVLLAGSVIIAVESISMGVGSYISNKTEKDTHKRRIKEEEHELREFPEEEKKELQEIYVKDGWPIDTASIMVEVASQNEELMLKEMSCHELGVCTKDDGKGSIKSGVSMFFSYIVGGLIPLLPYFIFPFTTAMPISITITMIGLFLLGVWTTRYSKRVWWKAGLELFALAGLASVIGYLVGQMADKFLI